MILGGNWFAIEQSCIGLCGLNYVTTTKDVMTQGFLYKRAFPDQVRADEISERTKDIYCFTWWRHQMETFSALLAICAGNSPVTGEFPAKKPVARNFGVFVTCTWINGGVNNGEGVDLRRHRAHYDVTIMSWRISQMVYELIIQIH